jgi:hypothetical protein
MGHQPEVEHFLERAADTSCGSPGPSVPIRLERGEYGIFDVFSMPKGPRGISKQ